MTARIAALSILLLIILIGPLAAADKRIEVDPQTDFSTMKTFAIGKGGTSSRQPEINNALTLEKVEDVVRGALVARGLTELPNRSDLIVTVSITEGGQRGAPPPGMRGALKLSAGTLIVDMTRRDTSRLVWHAIYSDTVDSPATLAEKLPGHAKKLLAEFPPKKK